MTPKSTIDWHKAGAKHWSIKDSAPKSTLVCYNADAKHRVIKDWASDQTNKWVLIC